MPRNGGSYLNIPVSAYKLMLRSGAVKVHLTFVVHILFTTFRVLSVHPCQQALMQVESVSGFTHI